MSKKTPEERVREKLLKMNNSFADARSEGKLKRVLIIFCVCVLLVLLLIVLMISIKVKEINVEGDLAAFNETKVIEASEMGIGKSIFKKTSFGIKKTIKENLPMTKSVSVKKNVFTGKLTINIEFSEFDFFIKYGSNYYAVDKELRVLDKRTSKSEYYALGASYIEIPRISEPRMGEKLVFAATIPEEGNEENVVDKKEFDYVYEFLDTAYNSKSYGELNVLLMKDKFDVNAVYFEKYRVYFGSRSDVDIKFKMLDGVLADGSIDYAERAVIDITDAKKTSVRAMEAPTYKGEEGEEKSEVDFSEYFS